MRLEKVVQLAQALEIEDKKTGNIIKWELTPLQHIALERVFGKKKVVVGKPRQVGLSTLICLLDVLWAASQVSKQNRRSKCAIILDTEDKSMERLRQCEDFAVQMGLECRRSGNKLIFPLDIMIVALTAGGKRAGSSFTYSRYHLSEAPYWPDAINTWGSIKASLTDEGECVMETTMDITNALPRNLWYGKHGFENIFLSVEDEPRFRHDPDAITDEQWDWMKAEGYTIRAAASWFVNVAIEEEAMGDTAHAFRLFPQTPEHMFRAAASRWVMADPEILHPIRRVQVPGLNDMFHVEIYHEPSKEFDPITAVDTASGKERDSSVVIVLDRYTKRVLASFDSNKIVPMDLVVVLAHIQDIYTDHGEILYGETWGKKEPTVIIEGGGVGDATQAEAVRHQIPFVGLHQTNATKHRCLTLAKQAIEHGFVFGPRRLLEECQELRIDEFNKKRWLGKKDMVMAIGMALSHMADHPVEKPEEHDPKAGYKVDIRATLQRERRLRRRAGRRY